MFFLYLINLYYATMLTNTHYMNNADYVNVVRCKISTDVNDD